jgi:hypothetical protein
MLLQPGPEAVWLAALDTVQETVVIKGEGPVCGEAVMLTTGNGPPPEVETVKVAVCVTGPPGPWAVSM